MSENLHLILGSVKYVIFFQVMLKKGLYFNFLIHLKRYFSSPLEDHIVIFTVKLYYRWHQESVCLYQNYYVKSIIHDFLRVSKYLYFKKCLEMTNLSKFTFISSTIVVVSLFKASPIVKEFVGPIHNYISAFFSWLNFKFSC